MAKICLLLGTLLLAAACGPAGKDCSCVATAACFTAAVDTQTCGVGLVCCPSVTVADAG